MICYSIPWSLHVFIVEYNGDYCHLSKVNMSHWHYNDILRRTNLIHFCNRWFIKNNQCRFLKMNLFQLINSMKIRVFGFFGVFLSDPLRSFYVDITFLDGFCGHFMSIFSYKIRFNAVWKSNIFFSQNLKLYIYKTYSYYMFKINYSTFKHEND